MCILRLPQIAVLCCLFAAASGRPCAAVEFRVDNSVYAEQQKEPTSRSTTLFHAGMVYDIMQQPQELIIFDKANGRFDLVDLGRRVRAELTTSEVTTFTRQLKQRALSAADPLTLFMAEPKFEEQFEETSGELTLTSSWLVYRIRGQSIDDRDVLAQYREFSDWLVQLNAMLNPGGRPPFARLALNEALGNHNMLPREVSLTIAPRKGPPAKQSTIRSEHRLQVQVAGPDLDRIKQARQALTTCRRVPFSEYRPTETPGKAGR
jgi:hypothetical protein